MRNLLSRRANEIRDSKIFIAPNIPNDKLYNAIAAYGHGVNREDVLVLVDDTFWGGAKDGMMLTTSGVYTKECGNSPESISLDKINAIGLNKRTIVVNGEKFFQFYMVEKPAMANLVSLIDEGRRLKTPVAPERVAAKPEERAFHSEVSWEERATLLENELLSLLPDDANDRFQVILTDLIADIESPVSGSDVNDVAQKRVDIATCKLLGLAMKLPEKIDKNKIYNPRFMKAFQNEYVTFELFAFVLMSAHKMLAVNLDKERVTSVIGVILQRSLFPYILSKQAEDQGNAFGAKRLADVIGGANPFERVLDHAAIRLFHSRHTEYVVARGVDPAKQLMGNVFTAMITHQHISVSDMARHEGKLYNVMHGVYGERLSRSLNINFPDLNVAIEQVLVEMLE